MSDKKPINWPDVYADYCATYAEVRAGSAAIPVLCSNCDRHTTADTVASNAALALAANDAKSEHAPATFDELRQVVLDMITEGGDVAGEESDHQ